MRQAHASPSRPKTPTGSVGRSSTSTSWCHMPATMCSTMTSGPWARKAAIVGGWVKAKTSWLRVNHRFSMA